mmetsp:Transcript_10703/g.43300  ORF Transcript_10703/g.43300 Transcript_10703/m.43300 type:complete len:494 (+) Transcript_10703:435-1916(+)
MATTYDRPTSARELSALDGLDREFLLFVGDGAFEDRQRELDADFEFLDEVQEVFDGLDLFVIDVRDEVAQDERAVAAAHAADEPGVGARRARRGVHDEDAVERLADARGEAAHDLVVGDGDADRGPQDAAEADDLVDDAADRVDGDREADAGRGARGREDGRVDADEAAVAVEQRAARVARVDRRVGLHAALDGSPTDALDLAADGRDDARGQRVIQAERIADGVHVLPDEELRRRADLDGSQHRPGRRDLEDRNVFLGLGPHEHGVVRRHRRFVARAEPRDRGFLRLVDDVEVRHDVALAVPHEARARARGNLDATHRQRRRLPHDRGRDERHGGRDLLEEFHGALLARRQLRDLARLLRVADRRRAVAQRLLQSLHELRLLEAVAKVDAALRQQSFELARRELADLPRVRRRRRRRTAWRRAATRRGRRARLGRLATDRPDAGLRGPPVHADDERRAHERPPAAQRLRRDDERREAMVVAVPSDGSSANPV